MTRLLFILALRALILAYLILFGEASLSPDEAQYWTWSQDLSYGYYSKPPMIAWQIFSTTLFFGSTEWGVRSSALLLGTLLPLAVYWLVQRAKLGESTAFWSALVLACTPLGVMGSFLAITDTGMILFWTLACGYFIGASSLNPFILGGLIAFGALFKWPIYFLPFTLLCYTWVIERRLFWPVVIASLISLAGLLPSLVWNLSHDFVTFRHVGTTLQGGHYGTHGNTLEFLGAQFGLVSPLLFIGCLVTGYAFLKGKMREDRSCWILFFVTLSFLLPLTASLMMKIQGNWADFAYPTWIVLLCVYLLEKPWGKPFILAGLALSLLSLTLLFSGLLPFDKNPLKNTLGWRELTPSLEKVEYDYLAADSYQMASLLAFYSPKQQRPYFVNLAQRRLNQFSFWEQLPLGDKRTGVFVFSRDLKKAPERKMGNLKKSFESIDLIREDPLYKENGQTKRIVDIFSVSGFLGVESDDERHF